MPMAVSPPSTLAELEALSVSELKSELDRRRIDYTGVLEKRELVQLLHNGCACS